MSARAFLAVVVPFVVSTFAGAAAQSDSLGVVVEPGVLTPGGALLPFRVLNAQGDPFRVNAAEVALEIGGNRVAAELVSFQGDQPTEVLWFVDQASFAGIDVEPWARELAVAAAEPHARLVFAGDRLEETAVGTPGVGELAGRLAKGRSVRLWDELLKGVAALSHEGDPVRRVLVVVSSGNEEKESRHPVVTCIDAADTARVAVYALSPRPTTGTDEAGVARLGLLTRRTGGAFDGGGSASAVPRMRGLVAGVQGLRAAGVGAGPAVVRPGLASARPAQGSIAPRRPIVVEAPSNPAIPGVVSGVLVLGIVGCAWIYRRQPIGRLVTLSGLRTQPVAVPRSGITLGGAQGNGLVLDHPKISRNHAVIQVRKGKVTLVDLKSSNGTRLNGRPVESARLADGDRITLADAVELRFERFRFGRSG